MPFMPLVCVVGAAFVVGLCNKFGIASLRARNAVVCAIAVGNVLSRPPMGVGLAADATAAYPFYPRSHRTR
jgi:hypothetical protein